MNTFENCQPKPVKCGCGGEARIGKIYGDAWTVECTECGIQSGCYDTEAEAIQAWNKAMGAERCCDTCDSYEAGRYCLLWSIFCPSDHWCKDWSGNE